MTFSLNSPSLAKSFVVSGAGQSQPPGLFRRLGEVLTVALVYPVAGKLALLLAIPPGYATAVWPAAGLALAGLLIFGYRAWPGVWLGSFLVNAITSLDSASLETALRSCALPLTIGLGATLQAIAGALVGRPFCWFSHSAL